MHTVMSVALAGAVLSQIDMPSCDGACVFVDVVQPGEKDGEVQGTVQYQTALRTLIARCTAYSYTGSRTRTGTIPRWGTVAVDPTVIPLGSRLLIEGYPGTVFVAEDTGGGVWGNHVDIFFESYAAAIQFGVQTRTVTVLGQ